MQNPLASSPGWFQLLGPPQSGKTLLATLLCRSRNGVWITTDAEYSPGLWGSLGWAPRLVLRAERVRDAFGMIGALKVSTSLIILDSLATLLPNHSQARTIGNDVERALFIPEVPVLVINQERYPHCPGGSSWVRESTNYRIKHYRSRPGLLSEVEGMSAWLVWWPGQEPRMQERVDEYWQWLPRKGREELDG